MKKLLINYGVIAIFYLVVVLGVLFLCTNTSHKGVNNVHFNSHVSTVK